MYYDRSSAKVFWISFLTSIIVSAIVSFSIVYFVPDFLDEIKEEKIEVPNVEGIDINTAQMIIEKNGFLIDVERVSDPNVKEDKIIYQNPVPGTQLDRGGIIKVVVSEGSPAIEEEKEEIIIPDVTGFELNQARVFLSEKGITVGKIEKKVSSEPEDEVISTVPDPGTKITADIPVKLIISLGPGKVEVPNVKRISLLQAKNRLSNSELKLGKVIEITSPEYPFDIIISQDPEAGEMVEKESSVNVTINREAS